jgi:hypothetical protein
MPQAQSTRETASEAWREAEEKSFLKTHLAEDAGQAADGRR